MSEAGAKMRGGDQRKMITQRGEQRRAEERRGKIEGGREEEQH